MRTVKLYQALIKSKEANEDEIFGTLQADFILTSREAKFLFGPESGVYDLLSRLNIASFKITGLRDMPKGLPPEQIIQNQEEFSEALRLWNTSIEPLEDSMAPYLNYHYVSAQSALVGQVRKWWSRGLRQHR
jgi:hypothetical protein